MPLVEQLVETWAINNRANLKVLDSLETEALEVASRPRARTVGDQFAHIHNVRLMWFKVATPELLKEVAKIEKGAVEGKEMLRSALIDSSAAMEKMLEKILTEGKVKGFKPHPAAFLGYFLAHEGHHRGQILLTLKLAGVKIDQKTQYGIWEWGTL